MEGVDFGDEKKYWEDCKENGEGYDIDNMVTMMCELVTDHSKVSVLMQQVRKKIVLVLKTRRRPAHASTATCKHSPRST